MLNDDDIKELIKTLEGKIEVQEVPEPSINPEDCIRDPRAAIAEAFESADDMVSDMSNAWGNGYFSPYIFSLDELEEESPKFKERRDMEREMDAEHDEKMEAFFEIPDYRRKVMEEDFVASLGDKRKFCQAAGVQIPPTYEERLSEMYGEMQEDLLQMFTIMNQKVEGRFEEMKRLIEEENKKD